MSQWTHVCGCIRIDGLAITAITPSLAEVANALGPIIRYDSPREVWDRGTHLPLGSEGSLEYQILRVGDGLVLWTVPIWGDLRDYANAGEIITWFDKVTKDFGFLIRDAILSIHIEGQDRIVRSYNGE